MIEALRRSGHRGESCSAARSRSVEATSRGEDALRTSGAVEFLFTSALARTHLPREPSLGAACGDATGERRGVVIRTAALSVTPALRCRRRVAGARSRAWGETRAAGSVPVGTFVAIVRAPMQKFCFHVSPVLPRLSPNHAMERTATRLASTRRVATLLLVLSPLAPGRRRSSCSR